MDLMFLTATKYRARITVDVVYVTVIPMIGVPPRFSPIFLATSDRAIRRARSNGSNNNARLFPVFVSCDFKSKPAFASRRIAPTTIKRIDSIDGMSTDSPRKTMEGKTTRREDTPVSGCVVVAPRRSIDVK